MDFGSGKNEFHMSRRLFHSFQQHVPRRLAQHVDFVDDIDLIPAADRTGQSIVRKFPHIRRGVVAGGVNFKNSQTALCGDGTAAFTLTAGIAIDRTFTIQRLGKDTRQGGLSDTAGTYEQIRVCCSAGTYRIPQRSHHMLLPDHIPEGLRPPFTRDDLIFAAHCTLSNASR